MCPILKMSVGLRTTNQRMTLNDGSIVTLESLFRLITLALKPKMGNMCRGLNEEEPLRCKATEYSRFSIELSVAN